LLKNITLAGKLKYMGYKIKINAMVFRFGLMGFWGNGTIRGKVGLVGWKCPKGDMI